LPEEQRGQPGVSHKGQAAGRAARPAGRIAQKPGCRNSGAAGRAYRTKARLPEEQRGRPGVSHKGTFLPPHPFLAPSIPVTRPDAGTQCRPIAKPVANATKPS